MENQSFIPIIRNYFEHDPVRAAHSLENVEVSEAPEVLRNLPSKLCHEALSHLQDALASQILVELSAEQSREIMELLDPQKTASIFRCIPQDDKAGFLEKMSESVRRNILEFLTYPNDSAGQIMTTDFLAFHSDLKVREAIEKIRLMARKGNPTSYVYVVDSLGKLVGVLNMRDMMLAAGEDTLGSVMRTHVFTIDAFTDREQIAAELSKRKFFAVPVVDSEKRLLGVIKAEQLIEDVQEEASEDMQKMFGAGGDERAFSPMKFSLTKRLPWLYVNLATAFLAAWVVSLFQNIIAQITVLAVYLPIVAGQGGNAGAQSLAVVMRGIVMREIPARRIKNIVLKEAVIGIINGVLIGLVTAFIALLWHGNPYLGLVIGLGMLVNLFLAGFSGAAIPLAMKGLGLDPAQCSNIILTTVTDVMGFFSFLGFAVLFQSHLK